MDSPQNHERYMREALKEAARAFEDAEVPIGAVIVHEGKIIARAHNQRERLKDPTAHAEMIALTQAAAAREDWRLNDAILYVTLEPCMMCFGALLQARVSHLVYGTENLRDGIFSTNHEKTWSAESLKIDKHVLTDECRSFLQEFFKKQRLE